MSKFKDIAKAFTGSRAQFADHYDQLVLNRFGRTGLQFKTIVMIDLPPADRNDAFKGYVKALARAEAGGWLDEFVSNVSNARLFKAAAGPTIQSIVDPDQLFLHPIQSASAMMQVSRRVCMVRAGENAQGTGFLVGPQTVLTCWHVIRGSLEVDGTPKPDSGAEITLTFDDVRGRTDARTNPETYMAAEDWLLASSECHPKEIPTDLDTPAPGLTNLADAEGKLDFALIRVNGSPGRERGYYKIGSQEPSEGEFFVFQHPNHMQMRYQSDAEHGFEDSDHPWRYAHKVNTRRGASGGLCLDSKMRVVGLHQSGVEQGNVFNRAVPTAHIAPHIDQKAHLVDPTVDPLQQLRDGRPIFEVDAFQRFVWRVASGEKTVLWIDGSPRSGKTFLVDVLEDLLPSDSRLVVRFEAPHIPIDPHAFAEAILSGIGAPADRDPLPKLEDAATTPPAWITDQLFPALINTLKQVAGDNTVWIVIDELSNFHVPNSIIRTFLEQLYAQASERNQYRVVLVGLDAPTVPGVSVAKVADFQTEALSEERVAVYLQRRYTDKQLPFADRVEHERLAQVIMSVSRTKSADQISHAADFTARHVVRPLRLAQR